MRSHYSCGVCKKLLESTEENFFSSSLNRARKNSNLLIISKCKFCANQYATQYRNSIKTQGLVRSQKNTTAQAGAVRGTLYVIGPDIPGTPYKIGITAGSNTDKRKTALQTSHWMNLKLVWKSDVLDRVDIIETKLHQHFAKQRVRGEWFNISPDDIKNIPMLVQNFRVK